MARDARLLEGIVRDFAGARTAETFRALIATRVRDLTGCAAAWYLDRPDASHGFTVTGVTGSGTVATGSFDPRGTFARWLRVNDETLVFADRPDVLAYLDAPERDRLAAWSAIAAVPLVTAGQLVAFILLIAPAPIAFRQDLVQLLDACGHQAAVAAETIVRESEHRARREGEARAHQLAVAGQFATAVAHEVRNPLSAIRSGVQYVIDSPADWTRKAPVLQHVIQEVDRISGRITGVLGLSRPQPLVLADHDLRHVIDASLGLCQPHFEHHRLTVVREPLDQPLPVRADAAQLRQVFLNVLLNAVQASPAGGRLRVAAGIGGDAGAPMAEVRIEDTGTGIPADALAHVFEPFFTTKDSGTGMGLPICRDIMQRHDGAIRLDSTVGVGTTVRLTLPLTPSHGTHPGH